MTALLAALGRPVLGLPRAVGRVALFAGQTSAISSARPSTCASFAAALADRLVSLPVVGLTAIFTGGALALQIYAGGSRFNAESVVPQIVAIGMTRELGAGSGRADGAAAWPPPSPPRSGR